jgi:hypothetical protein
VIHGKEIGLIYGIDGLGINEGEKIEGEDIQESHPRMNQQNTTSPLRGLYTPPHKVFENSWIVFQHRNLNISFIPHTISPLSPGARKITHP